MIVQKESIFPLEGLGQGLSDTRNDDIRHEYHSGGCYLGDILKFAERKIETLIEQAVRHYGRDSLWRQVLNVDDPEGPNKMERNEAFEWTRLFLEKIRTTSRSALAIDAQLNFFVTSLSLPWLDIFGFLKRRFSENARELVDYPIPGVHHLLLFNPNNSDYLLHMTTWIAGELGLPEAHSDVTSNTTEKSTRRPSGQRQESTGLQASRGSWESHSRESLADMGHLTERLVELQKLGGRLARRGEYQIDIMSVSREGVADEIEYGHINEVVSAISFWLWGNSRA
ncbi:hypothetical protein BC829DRAFT_384099 [Chytridium lagenaria]|nr:hypothetical protein BC829DRAFT_384099 [Chytridium lagenaria]